MKWFVLAAIFVTVVMPIHAQEQSPQSTAYKNHAQGAEGPSSGGVVINQETTYAQGSGATSDTKSYLSRLFSPENLPNVGLFFAGIVGIIVAIRTLRAISRQVDLLDRQITIPFRAYLAVGEPEHLIEPDRFRLKFRIRNYGHMAAGIKSISMEVIVQVTDIGTELFRRDSTKQVKHTIPPERDDMLAVEIELPIDYRNHTFVVSGNISYDTGFNQTDSFEFVRVFDGWSANWTTASVSESFDFTDAKSKKS